MKKYKLIKKYLGTKLEIGDIIEFDTIKYPNQYVCKIKNIGVSAIEPSDFPEFWEEIKELGKDGFWSQDGIDRIWVEWDDNTGGAWLESIEHYKPLFISVDGKEIYKGDTFYVVDNRFYNLQETCGGNFQNDKWKNLRFANKEKALDYIIFNKPCLSLKDFNEVYANIGSCNFDQNERICDLRDLLTDIVKSKI